MLEVSERLSELTQVIGVESDRCRVIINERWNIRYKKWNLIASSELDPRSTSIVGTDIDPATRMHIDGLYTRSFQSTDDAH